MPRKSAKKQEPQEPVIPPLSDQAKEELFAVLAAAAGILFILSFLNLAGTVGTHINTGLSAVFGISKITVPIVLFLYTLSTFMPDQFKVRGMARLGVAVLFLSASAFLDVVMFKTPDELLFLDNVRRGGGYIGLILGYPLLRFTGFFAAIVVCVATFITGLMLTFNLGVREAFQIITGRMKLAKLTAEHGIGNNNNQDNDEDDVPPPSDEDAEFVSTAIRNEDAGDTSIPANDAVTGGALAAANQPRFAQADPATIAARRSRARTLAVPIELLENKNSKPTSGDIQGRMAAIQKTLHNFGIDVEMGDVSVGPTVTQFTLKPEEGVKLSRITALSDNLSLALAAHPIRVEAPIPGKPLVGIEVPNHTIATVGLRETLESKEFKNAKSNLTIALGKDVAGNAWVADLAKMPHMLVAGATGSGKTVCLNTILLSLLFQNTPEDLKLLLIDPKRVELPVYNGIPHLLTPAITEVPKIINALKWAITEMDRRFTLLSQAGKRDISSYNEVAKERMPYLVIVIDELADLMVASAAEVESSIIRLAQMARAVGIHLIVATQRPSVDVITGLIKANITTRIAFSVASAMDSRTILDTPGADKLIGRGDSLFLNAELSKPKRIQGCYVSDNDIRKVVDKIMSELDEPVQYVEGITDRNKSANPYDFGYSDDGGDELFEEAKNTVVQAGKASASYLQRRLKIGYARAARLLDLLEERGIIGPGDGAKPREVLLKAEGVINVPAEEEV